jgi:hypothetical protein
MGQYLYIPPFKGAPIPKQGDARRLGRLGRLGQGRLAAAWRDDSVVSNG